MTRASHSTVVIMARPTHTRRTGNIGNYPQWMRTLEEKYQKLHKKITENNGISHQRFSHQVGRSVYDSRLSHAIQKYREISTTKQNVIANSNTRKGDKQSSECVTNTDETSVSDRNQISKHNEQNKLTSRDTVNSSQIKDLNNDHPVSQAVELSPGNDGDCVLDTLNHVTRSYEDSDEEQGETLLDKSSDKVESGNALSCTDEDDDDETNKKQCDDGDLTKRSHIRSVKTSLSRSSKVTSKSCPAKIQSRKSVTSRPSIKSLLSRSKSAQKSSNMYIQMSEEAKHAITETIHEMNLGGDNKNSETREMSFIPSRGRRTIKSWVVPKKSRALNGYNASKVIEGASMKLKLLNDDGVTSKVTGNDSCQSSAGSSLHKSGSAILPEIQTENIRDANVTNNSMRLPGIGKYDIKEVNDMFEITPPGFDSRYNDVAPVEDRESETPPPDIRQRAIDKCSEWLTKYSK